MNTRINLKLGLTCAAFVMAIVCCPQSALAQNHAGSTTAPPEMPMIPGPPKILPMVGTPISPGSSPLVGRIDPTTGLPLPDLPPGYPQVDPNTGLPQRIAFPADTDAKRLDKFVSDNLPLDAVVDTLRQEFREMNFLIPKSVEKAVQEINLRFQLKNAGLRDILNAIIFATDGEITWNQVGDTMIVFQVRRGSQTPAMQPAKTPLTARTAQVINLSRIWGGMATVEIQEFIAEVHHLTAQALAQLYENFDSIKDMPKANYHPGTGVLVLVGPDYANKVFMDILKNIDPKLQSALTEKKKQEQGSVEPSSGQEKRR